MCHPSSERRRFLARVSAAGAALAVGAGPMPAARAAPGDPSQGAVEAGPYRCPPCGCSMDGQDFSSPGTCPACGMTLVPKNPPFEPDRLMPGTGLFVTRGGIGRGGARIGVHYILPRTFTPRSAILIVIPGAGRDGDEYRDAWVPVAEEKGILVAALTYPEADYDFAAYHLGGVVKDLALRNMPLGPDGRPPRRIFLQDEDISFTLETDRSRWLFRDFDRIFDLIVRATGSLRASYDLFGHSAGGQILHRSVLFQPGLRADRVIAANAGLYTMPDRTLPMPVGLKGFALDDAALAASLSGPLTVMLGERDDDRETGGTLLHTPRIDRFGTHRLARGRAFFAAARAKAEALSVPFRWRVEIVPDVGHDFRAMSRAAARVLYG